MLSSLQPWSIALLVIVVIGAFTYLCRLQAKRQSRQLKLAYSPKSELMQEFLRHSQIAEMSFEPYTFGLHPLAQTAVFIVYELLCQLFCPDNFERELIKVDTDGGTLGLDWDEGIPDPEEVPTKPILLLVPGVAGGSDNLYQTALIKEVRDQFKIVTLLFRGTDGVPITSGLLCHAGGWADIKVGIDHVVEKYVKDKETGEKRCRFYAYGCSMGASMLGLYLLNDADRAGELLDAAVLYGTPWDYNKGYDFFMNGYRGWPSWAVTMNLRRLTMSKQLHQLRNHMSKEDFEYYENAFANCNGYKYMLEKIWLPMFGHKSVPQFLNDMTINGRLHELKVPLFAFGAMDDVILNSATIPNQEVRDSDGQPIMIATSDQGAHCCHLTNGRSIFTPQCWYQKPCSEFLSFMEAKLSSAKVKTN